MQLIKFHIFSPFCQTDIFDGPEDLVMSQTDSLLLDRIV